MGSKGISTRPSFLKRVHRVPLASGLVVRHVLVVVSGGTEAGKTPGRQSLGRLPEAAVQTPVGQWVERRGQEVEGVGPKLAQARPVRVTADAAAEEADERDHVDQQDEYADGEAEDEVDETSSAIEPASEESAAFQILRKPAG